MIFFLIFVTWTLYHFINFHLFLKIIYLFLLRERKKMVFYFFEKKNENLKKERKEKEKKRRAQLGQPLKRKMKWAGPSLNSDSLSSLKPSKPYKNTDTRKQRIRREGKKEMQSLSPLRSALGSISASLPRGTFSSISRHAASPGKLKLSLSPHPISLLVYFI